MKTENKDQKKEFSSLKNLDLISNFLKKKTIKKNTFIDKKNNKRKKNPVFLSSNFGKNLLIYLLKKPKYLKSEEKELRKRSTDYFKKQINIKTQLSEKFKNIPGINKLHYLTDESLSKIIKLQQDYSHFYSPTPLNNIKNMKFQQNENIICNSVFRTCKRLDLNDINKKDNKDSNPINKNGILFIKLKNINSFKNINYKDLNKNNRKLKLNINESQLSFKDKNSVYQNYNLYIQPNKDSKNIFIENKKIYKKTILKKNQNRNNSRTKKRKSYTYENLTFEKTFYKNNQNNNNIIEKVYDSENRNKKILNKSSKVDRLLFKLENPYECFEDNVITNRPGDRFISFKNQIIKQKNKTIKMFNDYKMTLRLNESRMTKYIYQLFSDRNKNKNLYLKYY